MSYSEREWIETHNSSLANYILCDWKAQTNLSEKRMLFVVRDQVDQTLELGRTDDKEAAFLLDSTVFDLILRSVDKRKYEQKIKIVN